MTAKRAGRGWAYACAQLGGAASIAANIAHSFVPPEAAGPGWAPPPGAVISSVFWPVALFATIEAFSRVAWPDGFRWVALRFGGLLPVASVAAVVSYMHLSGLLESYGAGRFETRIGPLAVDGLMVIGTAALIATSKVRVAREGDLVAPPAEPAVTARDEVTDLVATEPPTTPELWERYAEPVKVELTRPAEQLAAPLTYPDLTPGEADLVETVRDIRGRLKAEVDEPVDQVAARRRSDEQLWHEFGDQLCREHIAAGDDGITQYRVGKITGADRRQARRLQTRTIEAVDNTSEEVSR